MMEKHTDSMENPAKQAAKQAALLSPCYRLAIALLSPCYRLAIALLSPCYRLAIALLSPCYRIGNSLGWTGSAARAGNSR